MRVRAKARVRNDPEDEDEHKRHRERQKGRESRCKRQGQSGKGGVGEGAERFRGHDQPSKRLDGQAAGAPFTPTKEAWPAWVGRYRGDEPEWREMQE